MVPIALIAFFPSLLFAGMWEEPETPEQRALREVAESTDVHWQVRGEAAIPDMIRALCDENENDELRYKAQDRLVTLGFPAIK